MLKVIILPAMSETPAEPMTKIIHGVYEGQWQTLYPDYTFVSW